MGNSGNAFIEMTGITKRFPGVVALDDVSLSVSRGEVVALVGENGAGKSTLMKMLSGLYHPDEGEIRVDGRPVRITDPKCAQALGISTIFQEPSLAPHLNAVQNVYLGRETQKGLIGRAVKRLDEKAMLEETQKLYAKFFPTVEDVLIPVGQLGALKNRVIEIVKALSIKCSLVIMDEPTAALAEHERQVLFDFVHMLKSQGIAVIYITHHLRELFGLVDRIVVMRDGKNVAEVGPGDTDEGDLVARMVGRTITNFIVKEDVSVGGEILRVEHLTRKGVIDDVNLHVNRGEIVGIAGLAGAGRTETVRAIVGADKASGTVSVDGKKCRIQTPGDAIAHGIGMLPENRKLQGALVEQDVKDNITLANLKEVLAGNFVIRKNKEVKTAKEYVQRLGVKTPTIYQKVKSLSGGNQQKVILAKWLFTKPKVLIFDEPTQGIDVGAKHEIYSLIADFVKEGGGILLVSSELPELMGLADRIYVMHQGRIVHEFTREQATEENITLYASGGHES
ncbi:sugar ABC transporter ATP-binding protein [Christensenella intestinihominis]|uniref:sugar ABC transporter ATP-binding protein n=1 Tax=Christensenella intestinihominis TaxID=1851429 RepID=UPI00082C6631|nr:sugar ABC transporter ATP-binding protein [Christensenella intestinihominis]